MKTAATGSARSPRRARHFLRSTSCAADEVLSHSLLDSPSGIPCRWLATHGGRRPRGPQAPENKRPGGVGPKIIARSAIARSERSTVAPKLGSRTGPSGRSTARRRAPLPAAGWTAPTEVPPPAAVPADPVQRCGRSTTRRGFASTRARHARPGWGSASTWSTRSTSCILWPPDCRGESEVRQPARSRRRKPLTEHATDPSRPSSLRAAGIAAVRSAFGAPREMIVA
jgi:hypothetical protein